MISRATVRSTARKQGGFIFTYLPRTVGCIQGKKDLLVLIVSAHNNDIPQRKMEHRTNGVKITGDVTWGERDIALYLPGYVVRKAGFKEAFPTKRHRSPDKFG